MLSIHTPIIGNRFASYHFNCEKLKITSHLWVEFKKGFNKSIILQYPSKLLYTYGIEKQEKNGRNRESREHTRSRLKASKGEDAVGNRNPERKRRKEGITHSW